MILTGGERNDITQIEALLDGFKPDHVLADKGYDGTRAMDAIAKTGAQPVVPRRITTASWRTFDPWLYKDRNAIERVRSFSRTRGVHELTQQDQTLPQDSHAL